MGRLRIKATGCKFKENDRRLREPFINGRNEVVTSETINDLVTIKDTAKGKSEQVLICAKRVEAQRHRQ